MSDRAIIEAIQQISGTRLADRVYVVACTVESVDESKRLCHCSVVDGRIENEFDVSLMAVVDDGLLLIPAVNSIVKVIFSDYSSPFVCQYSEIQKALLIVGNSTIEVTDEEIKFNEGTLKGLVKLLPLVQKLNNLENAYNDLVTKFNTHTHILALTAGTGTAAITATPETTVLQGTQESDLENTKITQ